MSTGGLLTHAVCGCQLDGRDVVLSMCGLDVDVDVGPELGALGSPEVVMLPCAVCLALALTLRGKRCERCPQ